MRKDHPLRVIRAMVDEVLKQLSRRFDVMLQARAQGLTSGRAFYGRWHPAGGVGRDEEFSTEG